MLFYLPLSTTAVTHLLSVQQHPVYFLNGFVCSFFSFEVDKAVSFRSPGLVLSNLKCTDKLYIYSELGLQWRVGAAKLTIKTVFSLLHLRPYKYVHSIDNFPPGMKFKTAGLQQFLLSTFGNVINMVSFHVQKQFKTQREALSLSYRLDPRFSEAPVADKSNQ